MQKGQTSVRGGIEDFLCPFTDMFITQGSHMYPSHMGIMANDVRGAESGVRYSYYAPCTVRCMKVYPESGQSMWQSVNNVRCANGYIGKVTFMIAHSNSQDCYVGQVVKQGVQLENMGDKGNATGVHCHIQTEQGDDISWYKNSYGVYQFNNEVDLDDMYFVDETNIINGYGGNWKTTDAVPVGEVVDQILHKGSYVEIPGRFEVIDVNTKDDTALVRIDGKDYWIACNPLLEVK